VKFPPLVFETQRIKGQV